jgi:hypothetical protein
VKQSHRVLGVEEAYSTILELPQKSIYHHNAQFWSEDIPITFDHWISVTWFDEMAEVNP